MQCPVHQVEVRDPPVNNRRSPKERPQIRKVCEKTLTMQRTLKNDPQKRPHWALVTTGHSASSTQKYPSFHRGASCKVGCMTSCPVAQHRHMKISTADPQRVATVVATASWRSWPSGGYFLGYQRCGISDWKTMKRCPLAKLDLKGKMIWKLIFSQNFPRNSNSLRRFCLNYSCQALVSFIQNQLNTWIPPSLSIYEQIPHPVL